MRTTVILEAGSNFRTLDDWKRMHEFATKHGCLLKGQLWIADKFAQKNSKNMAVYKRYEVPQDWVRKLNYENVFWTAFDRESLSFLITKIFPNYFKVACLDSNQQWMLDSLGRNNKMTFVSCGVYGLDSIRRAVKWYNNSRWLTLMHAVVAYKPHDFQLGYFHDRVMGSRLIPWGVSMNWPSTVIPAAAVAMGATTVEVHFKLHHITGTPDAAHSLTKDGVLEMIRNIKEIEANMGNNERPLAEEMPNIRAGKRLANGRRR